MKSMDVQTTIIWIMFYTEKCVKMKIISFFALDHNKK